MPVYLQYYFWLIAISLLCLVLERLAPWRKGQKVLRPGIAQDLFWLVFNGHYLGLIFALLGGRAIQLLNTALHEAGLPVPESLQLLSGSPVWVQFVVLVVVKDFVEWNIHRLLHNVPWLWEFHKLHHSIVELDWIGNFRFHWMEIVVYQGLTYFPLVVLGVDGRVILAIAIAATLIGHLNHSNLDISWGPARYLINSPRMHVWHHDRDWPSDRPHGVNFGICLSAWDWLFGTAYWPGREKSPEQQPGRLGFDGLERFPRGLLGRLFYPATCLAMRRDQGS
jgi:sterol desaturase/sphingolipid hydroxylase (fatty acid hydroxylase superfamily)